MNNKLISIIFLFLFLTQSALANNNSVIITVGNSPITRLDLFKEIKFISILSQIEINEKNKDQIRDAAIQSLIKREIMKSEITRLKVKRYSKQDLNKKIANITKSLGLDDQTFKNFLINQNLKIKDLTERFIVELKWNSAIFDLYKNKVSLNTLEVENKIASEIEKQKKDKFLLISEIQVGIENNDLDSTIKKVFAKIEEVGFEVAAKNLSISASAQKGGDIGWINEKKLSKNIYDNVKDLNNGDIGKPLVIENTIVFIKKVDEKTKEFNIEEIKQLIVNQEKSKKLEMFSNSHYSDLERKIKVKFL